MLSHFVRLPMKELVLHFFFISHTCITGKSITAGKKFASKRFDMVKIPLSFKLSFSQSKIYFFWVKDCCCTFVYRTFLSAMTIEGTICLHCTVKIKSLLCFFFNNLFVMSFDYLRHVLNTTLAYFNSVFANHFM